MVEVAVANKHVAHGFEWDASGLKAIELLRSFGWTDIIDLGDITTARDRDAAAYLVAAVRCAPEARLQL